MYNEQYEYALKIRYSKEDDSFFDAKLGDSKDNKDLSREDHLPHLVHADYLEEHGKENIAKHIRDVIEGIQQNSNNSEIRKTSYNHHNTNIPTFKTHLFENLNNSAEVVVNHGKKVGDIVHNIYYLKLFKDKKDALEHFNNIEESEDSVKHNFLTSED